MKFYAIIVAGGSGNRMNSPVPKQFLLLNGEPVLMHTLRAFQSSDISPEILLVLHPDFFTTWHELCLKYEFNIPHRIVAGGKERFNSVKNALSFIDEDAIIGVHDAVRPVVSNDLINRCFHEAILKGAVIPVIESRDSLRKKEGELTRSIPREDILIVQTPQAFKSSLLKEAYQQEFSSHFTDDASVVEKNGADVHTTKGDSRNIKITYPEDIQVASFFLTTLQQKDPVK